MTTDAVAQPAEQLEIHALGKKWNLATRIGFRFAFCYWLLYCLPNSNGRYSLADLLPGAHFAYFVAFAAWGGWSRFEPSRAGDAPPIYGTYDVEVIRGRPARTSS